VTQRRRSPKRRTSALRLDPYLAYLVFAAVGVGTHQVGQDGRLVLLWSVLLGASLVYADHRPIKLQYALARMGQGAAVGLVLSVPLLILATEPLQAMTARLYPLRGSTAAFQGLVLIAAPIEETFFRGVLQEEHGFWAATGLYGLAAAIFFLPSIVSFPAVLLAMVAGMTVLGVVYGYVALRYGLAASIACHATANLALFVLPLTLGSSGV
jgi:membrane protease YdiL (CAAX protease family)